MRPARRRLHPHAAWIAFLLAPPLILVGGFIAWPLTQALGDAFYAWDGLRRLGFVGFRNFADVLWRAPFAPVTWRAFGHNVEVLAALAVLQNGGAFLLAWALWREPRGHRFHRTALFLPVVLSDVIVAFVWKLFLNPNFGLVNAGLAAIGLGALARPWLGDPNTALGALIVVGAWHWIGFPTLLFLAGMQRIPHEYIEAARLDGMREREILRHIIWPLVAPSATVAFTLLFIGAFNWFELPYLMAGVDGSPFGHTDVLALLFYRTAFGNQSGATQDFGHGNAYAGLMFVFVGAVATLIVLGLRRREVAL
ncbi:MAG TPA: sugar ABC transporter permease [Acetobacteraceae bacterium]|nr:sugar ABC transporter permease [Acetobacteraceae bacterium]